MRPSQALLELKNIMRSNTIFFVPLQLGLTVLILFAIWQKSFLLAWWGVGVGCYFLTGCLGITVTFHRYLSHKTFKLNRWIEYLFTFFGCMGGTGSSIGWVGVHRQHHAFSDLPGDPHSPKFLGLKTFFPTYEFKLNKWALRDLITDPFHIFMHEYYFAILFAWGLLIATLFGLPGFIFMFAFPIVCQIWISVLSNFGNHKFAWGYQNFDTQDDSINSWWLALLTWGEGWHNNHHRYPGSYTFKQKWWEIDVSAGVIRCVRQRSSSQE